MCIKLAQVLEAFKDLMDAEEQVRRYSRQGLNYINELEKALESEKIYNALVSAYDEQWNKGT